jgi:GNAT superfamily N-acetyltransferase
MLTDLQLHPLDATDLAVAHDLHALLQAAHTQEAAWVGADDLPVLRRAVRDLQEASDDWIGAWVGGRLVGAVAEHADPDDDAVWAVGSLVVHPDHHRQGIGTVLLHAAVVSQGRRLPLSARVLQANAPAQALLRRAGFRCVRQWVEPAEPAGGPPLRWSQWLRLPG